MKRKIVKNSRKVEHWNYMICIFYHCSAVAETQDWKMTYITLLLHLCRYLCDRLSTLIASINGIEIAWLCNRILQNVSYLIWLNRLHYEMYSLRALHKLYFITELFQQHMKELSLRHKLNSNIFATLWCNPVLFQTEII